jgi:hypothetical protein
MFVCIEIIHYGTSGEIGTQRFQKEMVEEVLKIK